MAALTSWSLLYRSILNTPALDTSRFIKATEAGAELGLLDLEEGVPPERKEQARHLAATYFTGPRRA